MYVWIICPLTIMFYESNENRLILQRIWDSFKKSALTLFFMVSFIVFTRIKAYNIYIPTHLAEDIFSEELKDEGGYYRRESTL
jgi:hypothetical protein